MFASVPELLQDYELSNVAYDARLFHVFCLPDAALNFMLSSGSEVCACVCVWMRGEGAGAEPCVA